MKDTPGNPRQGISKYGARLLFSLFLVLILINRLSPVAETAESTELGEQVAGKSVISEGIDPRQEQIESLANKILKDMRKDDAVTTDTLFLKSGIQINCAILSETVSHYTISYNGLESAFPKSKVMRVENQSQESVEEELRKIALAKATRIVDYGLVPYGNEWILPDEKAYRLMKVQMRLEAKRIEAGVQTEIAEVEKKVESVRRGTILEVPITVEDRVGPQIFVEVTLVGKEASADITMLLDTGAAMTCILPDVADELGLANVGHVGVAMADRRGSVYPVVLLQEIAIQGMAVRRMYVFVAECGMSSAQGLLGADFLRHFEFKIDPEKEVMILKPR